MPIQAPQWTDYLNCPVCCREFGAPPRSPISLGCGHTLCRHCLKHLHRKQCPFDQAVIQVDPEELVVNTALLQLAGYSPPAQPYHPPSIQALPDHDKQAYDCIVKCMEHLAVYLKYCGNVNNSMAGSRLSRPMQRKLVMLLQCAITDEEGRGRAARAARSLGERTVTELILQHQNPQQLSANLWAAVRARGCQFLGPAMQEEVLKLVLLALEDGSALSRKVLVMFVVQRLEPHFPQASKTSIGHVVQLLYRASCFKVSKRECDSSLMQLKEEFRTYESLRREHDAQIVQIATEAGLRIAPDQWSALLYGDTAHKSHMQSIIDKLQTPQSFAQSVQELFIALQRTGDPAQLIVMSLHLDRLANIDASPDAKNPSWQQLAEVMTSLKEVVAGLIHYLQQQATGRDSNHNQKQPMPDRCIDNNTSQGSPQTAASTPTHTKYKVSMCRDAATRSFCPRGSSCTFAHSEEELERCVCQARISMCGSTTRLGQSSMSWRTPDGSRPDLQQFTRSWRFRMNGYPFGHGMPPPNQNSPMAASGAPFPPGGRPYPPYIIQQQPHLLDAHNYNVPPMAPVSIPTESEHVNNGHHTVYPLQPIIINQEIVVPGGENRYYSRSYNVCLPEEHGGGGPATSLPLPPPPFRGYVPRVPMYTQEAPTHRDDHYTPIPPEPEFRVNANTYGPRPDAVWAPNPSEIYNFGDMLNSLPPTPAPPLAAEVFPPAGRPPIVIPLIHREHSSPVESVGARAVGGPVSGPGAPEIPTVSANGPATAVVVPGRLAVGAALLARERLLTVTERLSATAQAYEASGSDDQELEAGLQALERRIDTEFKMAD